MGLELRREEEELQDTKFCIWKSVGADVDVLPPVGTRLGWLLSRC